MDGSDIHRFPAWHVANACSLLENLGISEPSLSVLKKLKHHSDVLNIKYNCAQLFLDKYIGCLLLPGIEVAGR